ncbi:ADP-ribosyltransferase [Micromonospora sp. NPDC050686]|uniref:ADP-ribosyltransferase n=1 Tax=Micromonospora sp. NPDC050686 TaxID=3154631 RepID=UPI0033D146A6
MTAGVANPLVAQRQDSTQWYSGVGVAESIADLRSGIESGSWVDLTIGGFGTSMEALAFCTDPLGSLVSWGVAWLIEHVQPLSDALDWLAGDPDQIAAYAQTWRNVARHVGGQATALGAAVTNELAEWTGTAADAYRRYAERHLHSLTEIGGAADLLGLIVEGAGLLVSLVRELVRDLIADFVSVLAVRLWEWLAEAGLTLGIATPWVATQVSALVAKWVAKVAKLLTALASSISRLRPILARLGEIVDTLESVLKGLRRTPGGGPGTPDLPTTGPRVDAPVTSGSGGPTHPPWATDSPAGGPGHSGAPGGTAPHAPGSGGGPGAGSGGGPGAGQPHAPGPAATPHPGDPGTGQPPGSPGGGTDGHPPPKPDPGTPDPTDPADPTSPTDPADPADPVDPADPAARPADVPPPREFGSNADGAAYGRDTWAQAQSDLTPDQADALRWYTGENPPGAAPWPPDYKDINGALRGHSPMSPELSEVVDRIDESMGLRPVPENVMVTRETGLNAFNCDPADLVGSVQREPAYLSTALGPDPNFAPHKPVVLHLEVPAGTPAMYVDGVSKFPAERELLLGRGQTYVIDSAEYDAAGRLHLKARIIPGASS